MKKTLLSIIIAGAAMHASAQTCTYPLMKSGTVMEFKTEYAAGNYSFIELKANAPTQEEGGTMAHVHFASKKVTGETTYELPDLRYLCRNDSIYVLPLTTTSTPTPSTLSVSDATVIPANLKVGDSLPTHSITTIMFLPDLKVERKNVISSAYSAHYNPYNGVMTTTSTTVWEITQEDVKNTMVTLMSYANRFVNRKEQVQTPAGMKDAYVITTSLKSLANLKIDDDDIQKKSSQIFAKSYKKMKSKGMNISKDGTVTQTIEEWYVPGMGIIKQVIHDAKGKLFSTMTLTTLKEG